MQVLVASPPLQHFFSQPNAKMHPGPLGGAMQEIFDQTCSGKNGSQYYSIAHDMQSYCLLTAIIVGCLCRMRIDTRAHVRLQSLRQQLLRARVMTRRARVMTRQARQKSKSRRAAMLLRGCSLQSAKWLRISRWSQPQVGNAMTSICT